MINFKVGIMGAGNIAGTIAETLNKMTAFEPYAIASRDMDKANEFGDRYDIPKRYGSYEELVNDPDVELIYIATPHSHHAEQAKMCINAGKPVLVEKAFSYNAKTAEEVLKLSEEKKVFCGEAMWIRYMPTYQKLAQILHQNVIGKVTGIQCSLGYDLRGKERLARPELAGGALLDLGVYPINLMIMFFGCMPSAVFSNCARINSGVDAEEFINLSFSSGQIGSAAVSMLYKADNNARMYATEGYVEIDNINNPEQIRVYKGNGDIIATIDPPENQITAYEYEFIAARDAIITGNVETLHMPHKDTVNILRFCDSLREKWGVKFPMEESEN